MHNNFIKMVRGVSRRLFIIISVLFIVLISSWFLFLKDILADIETIAYDGRAKIATEENSFGVEFSKHDPNVVLLVADDETNRLLKKYPGANLGRWPWPRSVWGDVVNFISRGKPKAIVFDLKFRGA